MFIKLTYYDKGTPTLINTDNVNTIYPVFDTSRGRVSTKIQFKDGTFMNVEENIGQIQKIEQDAKDGLYQDTSFDNASVEELLKNSFNRQVRPAEKNYNTREFHHRP